ncbi:hypothetical protein P43SY_006474 [Pythium insidiosum]|uniref:Helicase-associated domain-containing protein n=1 Tax=Pythium insidiosum TaxID=114742 RepID=A0AAD5LZ62_PYTIN|nr:hypothetical protein P43SY_006474 [Pythium insidiosum]
MLAWTRRLGALAAQPAAAPPRSAALQRLAMAQARSSIANAVASSSSFAGCSRFLSTSGCSVDNGRSRGRRRAAPRASSPANAKRQKELAQLVEAVHVFHEREGHFAVPINFIVPTSARSATAWPTELRGFTLGVKIHKLMQLVANDKAPNGSQQHIAALEAMGFPVANWRHYLFNTVLLPSLRHYQRCHDNLFVPQKFVVPADGRDTGSNEAGEWPRTTWGYPLGLQVAKLRRDQDLLSAAHVDALNAIGFVWNVRDAKWHEYFMPGLRLFKELHGHADVPLAFVIPSDGESDAAVWPQHLRGYHLGRHVYMVRSGKYAKYIEQARPELDALGFAFDVSDNLWHYTIFPALEIFSQLHGHCDVPQDFVVPAEDPWPESAYGWRLGHTVRSIRHQGIYEEQVRTARKDLDRIGFVWNAGDRVEATLRRIVLPAMRAYQTLHGDILVSTDFVVPRDANGWPSQARGFRLGHWITRVRAGQIDLPKALKQELDTLGFVWRFNDERWKNVLLPAFRVYAELHGSCRSMSTKFHVPHEPPYPKQCWGVNLGGAMWHIKNGDTYVNDPLKERELKRLGLLA